MARVLVIGGGLHGFSAAFRLAEAGHRVMLIEAQYPGRHASGVNAGGVRRLGRHPAEIPLSVAALERWRSIRSLLGDDCGFRPVGQFKVAENADELEKLERREAEVRALGFEHERLIKREALYRHLPALSRHCVGALWCEDDGSADPYRTLRAWRRAAERLGVAVLEGSTVVACEAQCSGWRVALDAGKGAALSYLSGDWLINCAGAWAGALCAQLGEPVPMTTQAPMMIVTERLSRQVGPVVGAASRRLSFKQTDNGSVLIGGGISGAVDAKRRQALVDFGPLRECAAAAAALFPFIAHARIVRCWAGLEGVTSDGLPVLGPSQRHPRLIHSFGYSLHGFQLSAITGELVAALVDQRDPRLPIAPFTIARFTTQQRQ